MSISQKLSVKGKTGYVYTNTRVRVMKSKLLARDDFEKFLKMSLSEIARFLQEKEYKKEFDEFGRVLSGALLIEYALNKNVENQFSSVLNFSVRNARKELNLYLRRFDIMNIKTVLRARHSRIGNESTIKEIIAAGDLGRNFFKEMLEKTRTFEEAIEYLRKTEYYSLIKKHQDNMPKLEDEMDKFYYETLLNGASDSLRKFIGYEIALKNIAIKVRAKKYGLSFNPMRSIKKIRFDETKQDSAELRMQLKKDLIREALRLVSKFSRDATPVIGYFLAKENEIGNIRMIVRGKQSGMDESKIRQQLILGE